MYRLHLKAIEDHQRPPMPETPNEKRGATHDQEHLHRCQAEWDTGEPSSPIEDLRNRGTTVRLFQE